MKEIDYLKELTLQMLIHLPPSYLGDIKAGIEYKLNKFLMRYLEPVQGIMLAYSDIKLLSDTGKIIHETPHIHFPIQFKAICFVPTIGSPLVGKVNLVGADHLGLLVLGVFNASISRDNIGSFAFNSSEESWQHLGDASIEIKVDSYIRFTAIGTRWVRGAYLIEGSMEEEGTGLLKET
jgi:DNA-directed RNA polymerase I subunit RPA43